MNKFQVNINDRIYNLSELAVEIEQKKQPQWLLDLFRFILQWFDSSDTITQNTSGSTGLPKAIELKKSSMTVSARRTISFFNLKSNDRVWLCLPIDFIAGKMQVVRCLLGNLKLVVSEPNASPSIPQLPIKFTALVPMQLNRMLLQNQSFDRLDTIILGGAATSATLVDCIQSIPSKVYASYGMTETCSHIALQKLNGKDAESAFKVLDGIQLSVTANKCLVIDAPELLEHTIVSNDLVEFVDQNHFRIVGRVDNVINSGGLKISPEELEEAIAKEFKLEVILIGIPDPDLGQKLELVAEQEISDELWKKMQHFTEQKFGKNKTPKLKKELNQFPRTKSMKVVRSRIESMLIDDRI